MTSHMCYHVTLPVVEKIVSRILQACDLYFLIRVIMWLFLLLFVENIPRHILQACGLYFLIRVIMWLFLLLSVERVLPHILQACDLYFLKCVIMWLFLLLFVENIPLHILQACDLYFLICVIMWLFLLLFVEKVLPHMLQVCGRSPRWTIPVCLFRSERDMNVLPQSRQGNTLTLLLGMNEGLYPSSVRRPAKVKHKHFTVMRIIKLNLFPVPVRYW